MNLPSAVLFDFDGVVVDSLSAHLLAWDRAHQKIFGGPVRDLKSYIGLSTASIAKALCRLNGNEAQWSHLADEKRRELSSQGTPVPCITGVQRFMALLDQINIPYGIASNAPRQFIEETLSKLNMNVPIKFGIDDVGSPKPAPEVFLKCARALGVRLLDHGKVVVFEDSLHGIEAARKAGMFAVGVETQHDGQTLRKGGAHASIKDFMAMHRADFYSYLQENAQHFKSSTP
jgi:beta-phosphoglucomutase